MPPGMRRDLRGLAVPVLLAAALVPLRFGLHPGPVAGQGASTGTSFAGLITPAVLRAGPTFASDVQPADRQAILTAIGGARPAARRLVADVDGLVTIRVGPTGGQTVGLTSGHDGHFDMVLDLGSVYRSFGERGVSRLVLHEFGHVIDAALVPRSSRAGSTPRSRPATRASRASRSVRARRASSASPRPSPSGPRAISGSTSTSVTRYSCPPRSRTGGRPWPGSGRAELCVARSTRSFAVDALISRTIELARRNRPRPARSSAGIPPPIPCSWSSRDRIVVWPVAGTLRSRRRLRRYHGLRGRRSSSCSCAERRVPSDPPAGARGHVDSTSRTTGRRRGRPRRQRVPLGARRRRLRIGHEYQLAELSRLG